LVCALAIRSSLDHRPANPAMFALTGDPMVNTLILNSAWSVTHAVYGMRHEARSSEIYGQMKRGRDPRRSALGPPERSATPAPCSMTRKFRR
jgi:hypothetical protein